MTQFFLCSFICRFVVVPRARLRLHLLNSIQMNHKLDVPVNAAMVCTVGVRYLSQSVK